MRKMNNRVQKNGQIVVDSLALAPVSVLPEYQGNGMVEYPKRM
jgi:hypothetical protein